MTVSKHFPSIYAAALVEAMGYGWIGPRIAAINRITDEMAAAGLVRARDDVSRLGEWHAQRQAAEVVAAASQSAATKNTKR